MNEKRLVLIVEDVPMQFENLRRQFDLDIWDILHATDAESAMWQIEQAEKAGQHVEVAAID